MASAEWLEVGRIGAPYGVKGWVHVESFTDPPERLLKYRNWSLRRGSDEPMSHRVAEGREHGNGMAVRLDGVEDRNAAALLQGSMVLIARSALPPLKARQYYEADLIGLQVINLQEEPLGKVRHFVPTPAGVMMIVGAPGRDVWIPAAPPYLSKVDLRGGRVIVDWAEELE